MITWLCLVGFALRKLLKHTSADRSALNPHGCLCLQPPAKEPLLPWAQFIRAAGVSCRRSTLLYNHHRLPCLVLPPLSPCNRNIENAKRSKISMTYKTSRYIQLTLPIGCLNITPSPALHHAHTFVFIYCGSASIQAMVFSTYKGLDWYKRERRFKEEIYSFFLSCSSKLAPDDQCVAVSSICRQFHWMLQKHCLAIMSSTAEKLTGGFRFIWTYSCYQ